MESWTFEAIGTAWQVDSRRPLATEVRARVADVVERFDRAWSRFRDDSVVAAMAGAAGTWDQVPGATSLVQLCDDLHAATDGAFTPLVAETLAALGYDADYTLVPSGASPAIADWAQLRRGGGLQVSDDGTVTTDRPLSLDVGAAGKGLLVDLVSGVVGQELDEYTVDASGDLHHAGAAPLRVALEHPADPTRAVGVVELQPGQSLCASAINRRAWGDGLHHVLDGRTGEPTRDVVATWVVTVGSCAWADGLATAHFFGPTAALRATHEHEFVRLHADGRLEQSPGLRGELFR